MSGFEAERGGRLPRLGNNLLHKEEDGWQGSRTLTTDDRM